jgi:Sec-independent protein translocase protein TatA
MVLGLGSWEIVLVGLALLMLFGPEHAPGLLRTAGRMQSRFQQALRDLEDAVEEEKTDATQGIRLNTDELPSSDEGTEDDDQR